MKEYKVTAYNNKGKEYSNYKIRSKNDPDFLKMLSIEKSLNKNFSHLVVIINDEEVRIY